MSKKICVCISGHYSECKEFNSLEDVIEWAKEEIKKNAPLKIGDIVRVIDTGKCCSNLSKESYYNLYLDSPYDVGECLKMASQINHDGLGYLDDIKELPNDKFEVVALFKDTKYYIEYVLIKPLNNYIYHDNVMYHGYYIIAKDGVEKWQ